MQISLDNTVIAAHQLSFVVTHPIGRQAQIIGDLRYIRFGSGGTSASQSNFGGNLRFEYRTGRMIWFANASQSHSSQPPAGANSFSYSRGEFSGGLRFALEKTIGR